MIPVNTVTAVNKKESIFKMKEIYLLNDKCGDCIAFQLREEAEKYIQDNSLSSIVHNIKIFEAREYTNSKSEYSHIPLTNPNYSFIRFDIIPKICSGCHEPMKLCVRGKCSGFYSYRD